MRLKGIEALRVLAIFGVILIHTHPFGGPQYRGDPVWGSLFYLLNLGSRFAVPFFFLTSGYFFGKSLEKGRGPRELFLRYSRRLVPVFMIWSAIYGLVPTRRTMLQGGVCGIAWNSVMRLAGTVLDDPAGFVISGIGMHMWFLPSLVAALLILSLFISCRMQDYLIIFSVILFAAGLLAGSYSRTPLGIMTGFNSRNGPFFSALFVSLGWRFSGRASPGVKAGLLLLASGFILQSFEAYSLWRYFNVKMHLHDYLIGTVPFSVGVFSLGLACKGPDRFHILEPLGRATLGVYVSHPLIMPLVSLALEPRLAPGLFQAAYPLTVYIFSVITALLLMRWRFTRRMVS